MQALAEQYVEFELRDENYAVNISAIHEIIRLPPITEVPNSAAYVKGIINLRGNIIPIIRLSSIFDIEESPASKATRILVVNYGQEFVGLIVDRVVQVARFTSIQPPPGQGDDESGAFVGGIGISSTGLVGILRLDMLIKEKAGV
ncbi:chemotaxis protein CheW [Paenibacillus nasutitermitis]|uniref:Chemotaxis protein CheW n=2 Tax=Paenibacillus nasutitermitis TaxID=1652958 RepID=A0A916Z464_9BACL|nr:chemotaxis protein CheW [Paenibacillus nasutitermitis]